MTRCFCCCCGGEEDNGTDGHCTEVQREVCRLKWNWLYVILLSSLGTIATSSPLGTLHQFVTNPSEDLALSSSLSAYEPGLGESESMYAWSIAVNNIGGFMGAIVGAIFANLLPYWYGFLISLLCHISGFLFYGLAKYGWMIILARLLSGIFIGLERALAFSYFGVSYQHYLNTLGKAGMKESGKYCRVKDVLFALFIVSTSVGLLVGAGFSAIIARIHHIDYFRAVGWYNLGFGVLLLILQVFTFHGEYCWKKDESPLKFFKQIKQMGLNCWERMNVAKITLVLFLILCAAVIKARISVYEDLFNPILSDSFGFSEDVTVYFFLVILVAPILGGVFTLFIEWTRLTNLMISILGIFATLLGIFMMTDWQAIPYDPCLEYSVFHHPELLANYTHSQAVNQYISQPDEYCWFLQNETNDHPIDLFGNGSLQVVLDPLVESTIGETIDCKLYERRQSCLNCHKPSTPQVSLLFAIQPQYICYEPNQNKKQQVSEYSKVNALCTFQNSSCVSLCLELNNNIAETESLKPGLLKQISKSFIEVAHVQSLNILNDNQYHIARNVCESHEEDDCHWIPDSFLIKEHCIDCQPICRAVGRTLNFVQFAIGSFWFMFTIPIAETSLPIVISDSVSQEYQGLVMSIAVASTELLQGITPLWLSAAYEAVQKRTFLPLLILVATLLPFLFGLIVLYFVKRQQSCKNKTEEHSSQEESRLLEETDESKTEQ